MSQNFDIKDREDIRFDQLGSDRLSAVVAGIRFLNDIEKTEFFFQFTNTFDGPQHEKNFQRYLESAIGSKLDTEAINFIDVLKDRDALARMPDNSLANDYLAFLKDEEISLQNLTEAESIGAIGRVRLNNSRRNYIDAGTANHDLLHILTGYNRKPLGETLLLTFTASALNLGAVGTMARLLTISEAAKQQGVPIFSMAREARRAGQAIAWLPEIDWREMLPLPAAEVRRVIGITPPKLYLDHFPCKRRRLPVSRSRSPQAEAA